MQRTGEFSGVDARRAKSSSVCSTVFLFVGLCCLYYPAGWFATMQCANKPSPFVLAGAVSLWGWGMFLHFGSDCQKWYILHFCKRKGLIDYGFFAHIRHPNYLGEILIYSAFNLLSGHWIPWMLCLCVWLQLFLPNMLNKERSMSRHAGWKSYTERSGMLLPTVSGLLSFASSVLTNSRTAKQG